MPERLYVVVRTRKRRTQYFLNGQLRYAIKLAQLHEGERFRYCVLERESMVECIVTRVDARGGLRYRSLDA